MSLFDDPSEVVHWIMILVVLGMAVWSLVTRSTHLKGLGEVTRDGDPGTYWLVVGVELAVGGFLLYRALA